MFPLGVLTDRHDQIVERLRTLARWTAVAHDPAVFFFLDAHDLVLQPYIEAEVYYRHAEVSFDLGAGGVIVGLEGPRVFRQLVMGIGVLQGDPGIADRPDTADLAVLFEHHRRVAVLVQDAGRGNAGHAGANNADPQSRRVIRLGFVHDGECYVDRRSEGRADVSCKLKPQCQC